jgi:hypothetical protein
LDGVQLLGVAALMDMAAVNDPDASITDITTLPPRPLAPTALALNELDDVHTVDAVDEPPRRPLSDIGMLNATDPTTVTLILPDVAKLVGSSDEMEPPLYVNTTVTVPTWVPAVTVALREGDAPEATLDCTEVSEVHVVAMVTEPPTRPAPLRSAWPPMAPVPTTVTLMAAVAATLVTTMLLAAGPSNVTTPDTLPAERLDVNADPCDIVNPAAAFATTDVDDRQTVNAVVEPPTRKLSLQSDDVM